MSTKPNRLTSFIFIALILGLLLGTVVHGQSADSAGFVEQMSLVSQVFLRLIKMIIAPLVFSTLVVGIAKMDDPAMVGRVGAKTMGWFLFASLLSLTLGLVMVNLLRPGDSLAAMLPAGDAASGIASSSLSMKEFVNHLVPISIAEAMAKNEILQIVVFSILFGVASSALGEKARPLVELLDAVAHIMLKLTTYVMFVSPLAVAAAVAGTIAKSGLGVLSTYGVFVSEFYLSILLLWLLLISLGALFLKKRIFHLIKLIREPLLLSFSTASSEAAYPKTLEGLERFGVSPKIASFVLPIGYSFNLDGSMMYCTFATLFIAQAYGIQLAFGQQISMLLILMLTSKGMAGVPRASLVVIAATLGQFNIPEQGLLLLLGVDHFLDMARSATNVLGNSIATALVAKWEES